MALLHPATVKELHANRFKLGVDVRVGHGSLAGVVSLDNLAAVPLEEERPQLDVYANEVLVRVLLLVEVSVDIITFKPLDDACAVQVKAIVVLFKQGLLVADEPRVVRFKVIFVHL